MKNQKKLPMLLGVTSFLAILTSCMPQNEDAVLIAKRDKTDITVDNFKIPLDRPILESFIEGEKSFILYAGSPICHFCVELEPLILDYVEKTQIEFYYLNTNTEEFWDNYAYYSSFEIVRTPLIFIFKEGVVHHLEEGSGNLKTRNSVRKFFNHHVKTSNYTIDDGNVGQKPNKYVTINYNFYSADHLKVINEYFYPYFDKSGFNIYIKDTQNSDNTFTLVYGENDLIIDLNTDITSLLEIQNSFIEYFE